MSEKTANSPRRVVEYAHCGFCDCMSLGVQANGRLVRHTMGLGSVVKVKPPRSKDICPYSGRKIR